MTEPSGVARHDASPWPPLPLEGWRATYETLHRWTQIVGKIRLALTPWTNHSWHAALFVTSRGLTTPPIRWRERTFQIDFDFFAHELGVRTSDGGASSFALRAFSVADFERELFARLAGLGIHPKIYGRPNELPDDVAFAEDVAHAAYDAEAVGRFFTVLSRVDCVLNAFRARFVGKTSPVQFFWGSFDLTLARFSGRRAPVHPGGFPHLPDRITREAYSHEETSCGFWPGSDAVPYPAFYAYAYPEPAGYAEAPVRPSAAFYSREAREFLLPYDAVRQAADPDADFLAFCQSTYDAAADTGGWDRKALEATFPPEGPL